MTYEVEQSEELEKYLRKCYESDPDLLEHFHVCAGQGLEACVQNTLEGFGKANEFKFFVLWGERRNFAGYFGTERIGKDDWLTGFFLMPEMRNMIGRFGMWNTIKDFFNGGFFTGIWMGNWRAVNFCFLGGGIITGVTEQQGKDWYVIHFNN